MTTKDELLRAAELEYAALWEALRGLNESAMSEVWLGSWSIREIVAHMAAWHREMLPALERLARGERPFPEGVSYDDVDAWNAKFAAGARDAPLPGLLRDLDVSHAEFLKAAAKIPAERFQPGKTAWKIVDLNSAHHYKEHADQIRAWRGSRRI